MKKIIIMLAAVILFIQTISVSAIAERHISGDYVYTIEDGKASIIGYQGNNSTVEFPSVLDEYPVVEVSFGNGFTEKDNIKTVVISNGVERIRRYAFQYCRNLESVSIPNSVTTIGREAFENCDSLTEITIPESVTTIDMDAIASCNNLTVAIVNSSILGIGMFGGCPALTTVYLNDAVTEISDAAFYNCKSLSSIRIPENVTRIGDDAFYWCTSLTTVNIPESVTEIGYRAFGGNENLTQIIFNNPNTKFKTTYDGGHMNSFTPSFVGDKNLSIYAFEGTQAHAYAMEKQLPYTQLARVELNGEPLKFDVPPILENDRVLVPMRKIFETLGAEVDWNDETQTATAVAAGTTIELQIGRAAVTVNGEERPIDVSPKMMFNRTLVPVRAVSESMGLSVEWDNAAQTVVINN